MLAITVTDGVSPVSNDSIHIPLAAIPGFASGELFAPGSQEERSQKAAIGLFESISAYLSVAANPKLGFTGSKSNTGGGVAPDRISQTYNFTAQLLVDVRNGLITQLPTPSTGLGKFSLADILPGASLVLASAVPANGAGVLINVADLVRYQPGVLVSDLTISGTSDNRTLLYLMLRHFASDSILRSATVASAITSATVSGLISSPISPTFTALNSGIDLTKTTDLTILTRSFGFTFDLHTSLLAPNEIRYVTT